MERTQATLLAEKVLIALYPYCSGLKIAGSIRREKAEVNDVDIVAIPKCIDKPGPLGGTVHFTESQVWMERIPSVLSKAGLILEASGQELIRCSISYRGGLFQVDLYRARPETWGVILLVRTGSKEHNVKLCMLARSKGLKLSASEGVVTQEGFGKVIASRTEEDIFAALGLGFIEPRDREVS